MSLSPLYFPSQKDKDSAVVSGEFLGPELNKRTCADESASYRLLLLEIILAQVNYN